jgi:hypothetical protein
MFATIRKHQTWLWAFIIAAVIISFVIYFTPSVTRDQSSGVASAVGSIHGRPIERKEYMEAYVEAQLSYLLRFGTWPDSGDARRTGFNIQRETRNRLVLLDRVRALNIQVSTESVAAYIVENFGGDRPDTAKAKYDGFVQQLEKQHRVPEATFQGFIRHEIAVAHMAQLAGVAGNLISPRVAADLFRQENEKIEALAAVFAASNYLAAAQADPAALGQFYSNRQSLYRTPERLQLNYVKFDLTNFLGQADQVLARNTNFAADIERYYLSSNPNAFTDTNGQTMPPEAAKARLRQQARERQALMEAHKEAARFATNLETVTNLTADALPQLAAARGLTASVTDPFAETETPRGLRVMQNFTQMAFKLTPAEPVSISPIRGEDGVYLISLKEKIASQVPPLDAIRPRVEQEFKQDWAANQARAAGTNLLVQLTNGLAAGRSFEAVCTEAGAAPITLPKFTLANRPVPDWDRRVDLSQARAAAANIGVGKFSRLLNTRDSVFVLWVKARIPVPETETKAELPKFVENLRESRQYEAFGDWFRKQAEQSRIETAFAKDE